MLNKFSMIHHYGHFVDSFNFIVLSLQQRTVRFGINNPPSYLFMLPFHQGRMDEEVQGLLLQILRMSQPGP